MDRRKFLASTSTALALTIAGCNTPDETDETPTSTPNNSTETPTETPDDSTPDPNIDDELFAYEMPETMADIAAFGYNTFQERVRDFAFQLDVLTRTETKSGGSVDEQQIDFTYDKGDATFFVLQSSGEVNGDAQTYSENGFKYQRFNPQDGEITYDKSQIENEMGLFFYDGFTLIDQLNAQGVEVGEPSQVNETTVRYPIVAHRTYTTVSGHIDINLKDGLFAAVEMEGENSEEVYTMTLDYTYEPVTVETPAWVRDIDQ